MDEDKKSNEKEGTENESSEEESHKEGAVHAEQVLETTQITEGDVEQEHVMKTEDEEDGEKGHPEHKEKKTDDRKTTRTDGAEKGKEGKEDKIEIVETPAVNEDGDCKDEDKEEVKEEKVHKNINGKINEGQKSTEVIKMDSNMAHETEVQEMMNRNIEDLKKSSVEILPPEEGNLWLKTQHQTTCDNMQDLVTNKHVSQKHSECHEIKMASGESVCDQSSNHKTSSKQLLSKEQDNKINLATITVEQPAVAGMGETLIEHNTDNTVQIDTTGNVNENLRLFDNIDEEIKKEMVMEIKTEELLTGNEDMKKRNKTEGKRVSTVKNQVLAVNIAEGSVIASLESEEGKQTIHDKTKQPEKLSATDGGEGLMEVKNVSQVRESKDTVQDMSSCGATIQLSVQSETAAGKQQHDEKTSEKVKNETENKAKKENNVKDLSVKKEERKENEKAGQQNEKMGDNRQSDASFIIKGAPGSIMQKSVDEVRDDVQQKQICTLEEMAVKSEGESKGKHSVTLNSTVIPPAHVSDNKGKLQDIQNETSDMTITGRPICTVFQETVPGHAKCEESIQRSEIKRCRHNQEINSVKADNSLSIETTTKNQLKQTESKVQQSLQDKQMYLKQERQEKQQAEFQEQIQKQHNAQNQQEQNQVQQKKQHQQKNEKHKDKQQQQIETGQQQEQTKQKQQTQEMIRQAQKQEIQNNQKQEEANQHIQLQKQGKRRGQKEQDDTGKEEQCKEEQQRYKTVKQSQQEKTQEKQPKLWQHEQQQSKQQWKSKHLQEQAGKEKQQMTEQHDEEKPKEQHKVQQPEECESDSAAGCGDAQGRSCPLYFGVRSYLHQFYDSTPVTNSQLYEDYTEDDDFEYTVNPIKSHGCRKCYRRFWFRAGLWGGVNFILVGVITLLVGYLTPQRDVVVGQHNNLEILDRTAIAFNRRLEACRLSGLLVFCFGGVVLLFTLLLSTFLHIGGHDNNNGHCCDENAYYGYVTTSLVEPSIAGQNQGSNVPAAAGIKIPIIEHIKSVQPTLWPDIATVKDGTLVPHMP